MKFYQRSKNIDFITMVVFTALGIAFSEVTVFYIIYLFWFQEFVRLIIDFIFFIKNESYQGEDKTRLTQVFGNFFLMFIYFVFIVVIFGFVTNFGDKDLVFENLKILLFQNIFFDLNLIFFAVQYLIETTSIDRYFPELKTFNRRHIILHVSIIMGAMIQMFFVTTYKIESAIGSVLVAAPFLLLKYFFNRPFEDKKIQQT